MKKKPRMLLALLLMLMAAPLPAHAQAYGGVQLNAASDTDLGLGGRILGNIENANLEFVGSFDLYFPDGAIDFWEINTNLFYHFHLADTPSVLPYVGGGLNIARISNGSSRTETGVNLGGGLRFPLRTVSPFVEARAVLSDFDQTIFTVGLIFGHAHGR